MTPDLMSALRQHLLYLLRGGAHLDFDSSVDGLLPDSRGAIDHQGIRRLAEYHRQEADSQARRHSAEPPRPHGAHSSSCG